MGEQLSIDTGPNPYTTFEGKTYLKAVIVNQANSALAEGKEFILPEGVIFEAVNTDEPWRALKRLPFEGRFLAEPAEREGQPLHALSFVVTRVLSVPDNCPPVGRWEKVNV